jgi:hypothetical protein
MFFRLDIIQPILLFNIVIDILFVFSSIRTVDIWGKVLLVLVLVSVFIGINNNEISRRYITDILNPILFVLKIFSFKYIFEHAKTINAGAYFKKAARILLIVNFILIIVIFIMIRFFPVYIGFAPSIQLPSCQYLIMGNIFFYILAGIVVLLSGKRALLVSMIVCFLIYTILSKSKKAIYTLIVSAIIVTLSTIFLYDGFINKTKIFNKYQHSFDLLDKKNGLEEMSAGRFEEVYEITNRMSSTDYIIGKGVGFYYYVIELDGKKMEAANAHISPLGFVSKYGAIFYLFFLILYFRGIAMAIKKRKKNKVYELALYFLINAFIESFFAFNTFGLNYIPVLLGYAYTDPDKLSNKID